jgi:hypothetical protein
VKENFPRLLAEYEKRYSDRAFASPAYQRRISSMIGAYRAKYGIDSREETPASAGDRSASASGVKQLDLFRMQ